MCPYAHITGWGMAVPSRVLTNADLEKIVETDDAWIQSRTGICQRHIVNEDESTATLAREAALNALRVANLNPADLDLIIVSTSSPEHVFPATACLVQDRIGALHAGAFDLSAACSGFIFAVNMATQAIRSGSIQNAMVIGAETLSRFVNWQDRNTCILFGDGAGAFILQAGDEPGGLLSSVMRSDGSGGDLLSVPAGGSYKPASAETVQNHEHTIHMNGREVFRFASRVIVQATKDVVAAADMKIGDIQLVIPHQANLRIIEAAMRGLEIPMEQCFIDIERYGNTSTASIPIATCEAIQQGRLQYGNTIVFVGFGAGLTWGAALVRWTGPFLPHRHIYPASYQLWVSIRSRLLRLLRRIEGWIWGRDR
ncbi:MAG: 3-oxoacyl-ACP synthase [Anaerolineales bacterium]|nr:ketoacyl-ACP synthase III [Anaerolineae bacterium]PWB52258.1 MAG: 3-oxoacyl-ACP synthase [Anaerolineales bacterium]